jgi:hypothetical protein
MCVDLKELIRRLFTTKNINLVFCINGSNFVNLLHYNVTYNLTIRQYRPNETKDKRFRSTHDLPVQTHESSGLV